VGTKLTEHVDAAPAPGVSSATSVQLDAGVNVPAPADWKPTDPPGGLPLPAPVSVTVAVQVVGLPALGPCGSQSTAVEVERVATSMLA
jgi:hypothetical protein